MKDLHNLNQLREKIELYLDRALDDQSEAEVREFVNNNPDYNRLFQDEYQFRSFVKKNFQRPKIDHDFVQSLKSKLVSNIGDINH